jgi:hypothetical protein
MNKRTADSMKCALLVLRQVYTAARRLWPAHNDHESMVVKIDVAALKTKSLEQFHENASDLVWILAKQNEIEGSVKLVNVKEDTSVLKLIQHAMLVTVIDVHQAMLVFDARQLSLAGNQAMLVCDAPTEQMGNQVGHLPSQVCVRPAQCAEASGERRGNLRDFTR